MVKLSTLRNETTYTYLEGVATHITLSLFTGNRESRWGLEILSSCKGESRSLCKVERRWVVGSIHPCDGESMWGVEIVSPANGGSGSPCKGKRR